MNNLKPCPFCGGKAGIWEMSRYVKYVKCDDCLSRTDWKPTISDAIEQWNTRPDGWIKFTVDDDEYTNPIPCDEEEVLVTDGKEVWLDTFLNEGVDGCYFDSGREIVPNFTRWMPLPEPPERK